MNKLLILAAGVTGYVLGTKAGRERYDQIRHQTQKVWNSPTVQDGVGHATDAAKTAAAATGAKVAEGASTAASAASAKVTDLRHSDEPQSDDTSDDASDDEPPRAANLDASAGDDLDQPAPPVTPASTQLPREEPPEGPLDQADEQESDEAVGDNEPDVGSGPMTSSSEPPTIR